MFHVLAAIAVSIPLMIFNSVSAIGTGEVNGPECYPPEAVDDAYELWVGEPLTVDAPGVLANDTDPESRPLTTFFVSGPANGTVNLNTNGSFTYTPAPGFSGVDSFKYKAVNNGNVKSLTAATVTLTVKEYIRVYVPLVSSSIEGNNNTGG
jgi:hypothetical protein